MKTSNTFCLCIAAFIALSTFSNFAHARFKCWTNNEGIRECGEKVPPEYAQKGHKEMSKHGTVVEQKDRAKSQDEIIEQERLQAIEKEKAKLDAEQAKKDRILLDTFVSVTDIEAARDDKLAVIELDITATNKRNEKTQEDLDKRIQAAAAAERAGKAPNEGLLADIDLLKQRIQKNDSFIKGKQEEQLTVKADAQRDIERFNYLKGN